MRTLANVIKGGSLCALGQTAANPILSTMNKFPEEYHAHVVDKKCPAHVCKKLMQYCDRSGEVQEVQQMRSELPGQLH
jgi:NADP-reducing hydrogenase subunit HndC